MNGKRLKGRLIWQMLVVCLSMWMVSGCEGITLKGDEKQGVVLQENIYKGWVAALDGDRMVYYTGKELLIVDLTVNKELTAIPVPAMELGFDMSGDYVVWSDIRHEKRELSDLGSTDQTNADIFLYDLKTKQERQLTTDPSAQVEPKIWSHYVVWMDNRNDPVKAYPSDWQIALYDLETNKTKLITNTSGGNTVPDINDGKVVWEDGRNVTEKNLRAGENVPDNNTDIYLYDIGTGQTRPIATGPHKEGRPQISGSRVVWEDYGSGTIRANVFSFDLNTNKQEQITNRKEDQSTPVISGNFIAWMDERRGTSTNDVIENGRKPNSDIYLYSVLDQKELLMTGDKPQLAPLLSDHWLLYVTSSDVNPELHAVRYR